MHSDEDQHQQWNNDPDNWVWGIFYFNKNDNRLFLLKRNPGMGVTVNFANPLAYLFLIALILLMRYSVRA